MKKLILATVSAFAIFALAACSNSGGQEIATLKGGKITVEDFYNSTKLNSTSQTNIRNLIIYRVFNDKYGDKVSDKALDKRYNEEKKQYGDSFEATLTQYGYNTKTFKEYLKNTMVLEAGLKANIKLTDADLKTAWESFHPEVETQVIAATSEDDAKKILEEVKAKDADFGKIAKEKSTDTATKEDSGKLKFDSSSTTPPAEVKEAAYKLKDGEISGVITATDTQTYAPVYYIVKMVKNQAKGNDMKPYEKELKEIATNTKLNDSTFTAKIIGQTLKDANVKIQDKDLSNLLSSFIEAADTKSSSSTEESDTKASSTKESSAKDSSAKESSTKESSTAESK